MSHIYLMFQLTPRHSPQGAGQVPEQGGEREHLRGDSAPGQGQGQREGQGQGPGQAALLLDQQGPQRKPGNVQIR